MPVVGALAMGSLSPHILLTAPDAELTYARTPVYSLGELTPTPLEQVAG